MIEISHVSYAYNKGYYTLEDINFSLAEMETLALTGASGCGKTTLCNCILGLLKPTHGIIRFMGEDVQKLRKSHKMHETIQMVTQNPETAFDPNKTMQYSLREVRLFMKERPDQKQFDRTIDEGIETIGMAKELLDRHPDELSGGQLQRFSILRAMLLKPKIIILDEVTSMLDTIVQARIIRLLEELKDRYQLSYIAISHDIELLMHFSDRIIAMNNGHIEWLGDSVKARNKPDNPYIRDLIAQHNLQLV